MQRPGLTTPGTQFFTENKNTRDAACSERACKIEKQHTSQYNSIDSNMNQYVSISRSLCQHALLFVSPCGWPLI